MKEIFIVMTRVSFFVFINILLCVQRLAAQTQPDKLLFGVAYYDEYMPYERLEKDVQMMKDAGINVVRIAESTWSTEEPQEGVFDFSHIDRVLNAMHKAGIKVIVGTPTYAVPTWLVKNIPMCWPLRHRDPIATAPGRTWISATNIFCFMPNASSAK